MRETIVCALLNSHRRAACVGLARKKKKKNRGKGRWREWKFLKTRSFVVSLSRVGASHRCTREEGATCIARTFPTGRTQGGGRMCEISTSPFANITHLSSASAVAQWMSMTRMTSWIFVVSNNDADDDRGKSIAIQTPRLLLAGVSGISSPNRASRDEMKREKFNEFVSRLSPAFRPPRPFKRGFKAFERRCLIVLYVIDKEKKRKKKKEKR